ncbi:MAG: hypothetical protein JXB15_05300 [Anaerolineales bacterium]|nr:hypothetical protein [Anaerolineales bacterium]
MDALHQWLLDSSEPWTRCRTLVDLLELPESDPAVGAARQELLEHPQVLALITAAASWEERPLKRHNDASHPLYALSTLADFGLKASDPGMSGIIEKVLAHQSPQGAFQSPVFIPKAFGGPDKEIWTWVACDAPTLLYALLQMGLADDPHLQQAADHLAGLAVENGYHCAAAPELGRFHGPGRRDDPCPIANLYALKALSLIPAQLEGVAARRAAEMLLAHWEQRRERKYYLFGAGTDYHKLKYPFVWYDILHVVEALSRFPFVQADPRFVSMLSAITAQADAQGRYTPGSMYQSWKGWGFADKKAPSPWLTLLVLRILKRSGFCKP